MNLKLKDNPELELDDSGLFVEKITTLYINNCNNIDGLDIIRAIQSAQSSLPAAQKLNRVRVDIGNVSGSISNLMRYSTLNGFNDAYQHQTKPRLVGTWTINDWYTTAQLAQVQAAFDGLTIVPDSNYLIDLDNLAVQTLDSTKPNYNPALAVLLYERNIGFVFPDPVVEGQTGRYFLPKSIASNIKNVGSYMNVTSIVDESHIVSDEGLIYNRFSFDEFRFFTSVERLGTLYIEQNRFNACTILTSISLPTSITQLPQPSPGFAYAGAFARCGNLREVELTPNITHIGAGSFPSGLSKLHIYNYCTIGGNTPIDGSYKIYVGDGSSEAHDNAILAQFLENSTWAGYSSRLDTWYNYLHPTI